MSKKKKKRLIILGIILIIFLLTWIIISIYKIRYKKEKQEITYPEKQTIICSKEKSHDDTSRIEEVYLEKGKIISRTDTITWNKTIPKEQTCEYYTLNSQKQNALTGITSTINCNEYRGEVKTIYTIADMDTDNTKLKQLEYTDIEGHFDYHEWIIYMKKDDYTCEIKS